MDFDAGRYERLAISITQTHSVVPSINGVNIHYVSMLYPLLLAPFFFGGSLWKDLENANVASAYIMSSACIPAFLLARRLTTPRSWWPYFVALFAVCTPWIVTSMTLMTEVAAYPACAWAVYAMVVAVSSPSKKHDLLVVCRMSACFSRTRGVDRLAVRPAGRNSRVRARTAIRERPACPSGGGRPCDPLEPPDPGGWLSTIGVAVVIALSAIGRLSSTIGIYSVYSSAGHPAWSRLPRALVEHLATFSLGVGVVPCVIALAWIGANVVRPPASRDAHAFACVSTVMTVVVFVQATNFDIVVNLYIHDRFLMYFVPVMLVGAVLGITDERKPRWSLVVPTVLLVCGFAFGAIPAVTWSQFGWLDIDTPDLHRRIACSRSTLAG